MSDFKNLFKHVPDLQREEFTRLWLETEAQLNREFNSRVSILRGDKANLWRICLSRTLELAPA
jgi:hypothetical protein